MRATGGCWGWKEWHEVVDSECKEGEAKECCGYIGYVFHIRLWFLVCDLGLG